jgi:hypothetical protein
LVLLLLLDMLWQLGLHFPWAHHQSLLLLLQLLVLLLLLLLLALTL